MRDIRTPADPEDFETTMSRIAPPPAEFRVTVGAAQNTFTIQDRQFPAKRGPTASYRVYFVPESFGTGTALSSVANRRSALRVGSVVSEVPAGGRGAALTVTDTQFFGRPGYYLCVAVNQRGEESPPEHIQRVTV